MKMSGEREEDAANYFLRHNGEADWAAARFEYRRQADEDGQNAGANNRNDNGGNRNNRPRVIPPWHTASHGRQLAGMHCCCCESILQFCAYIASQPPNMLTRYIYLRFNSNSQHVGHRNISTIRLSSLSPFSIQRVRITGDHIANFRRDNLVVTINCMINRRHRRRRRRRRQRRQRRRRRSQILNANNYAGVGVGANAEDNANADSTNGTNNLTDEGNSNGNQSNLNIGDDNSVKSSNPFEMLFGSNLSAQNNQPPKDLSTTCGADNKADNLNNDRNTSARTRRFSLSILKESKEEMEMPLPLNNENRMRYIQLTLDQFYNITAEKNKRSSGIKLLARNSDISTSEEISITSTSTAARKRCQQLSHMKEAKMMRFEEEEALLTEDTSSVDTIHEQRTLDINRDVDGRPLNLSYKTTYSDSQDETSYMDVDEESDKDAGTSTGSGRGTGAGSGTGTDMDGAPSI